MSSLATVATTLHDRMRAIVIRTAPWIGALAVCLLAGEVASRLDDRIFSDIPLLSNPDRGRQLLVPEPWGVRGKPHGSFRKWQLNSEGFLGPELAADFNGTRLMLLGASETFGLYESKGHDYPALLAAELKRREQAGTGLSFEVINAAIAGMTLPSMTRYWENWASRIKPDVVVLYPSSHFYLDAEPPRPPPLLMNAAPLPLDAMPSRFAERMKDQLKQIPILRAARARILVSEALADKGPDYMFAADPLPRDRLAALRKDLEQLGEAIARRGAKPVLVTHAFRTPTTLLPSDRPELEYFRIFYPRATAETFPAFVEAARDVVIELGKARGWPVIDAAASLTGRRELFADPVHFNDQGSRLMAQLLADALPGVLARMPHGKGR